MRNLPLSFMRSGGQRSCVFTWDLYGSWKWSPTEPQNHFEHVTDNADKSNKTWSGGCCWLTSNASIVQACNFSLQYPYLMKHTGHENKGSDRQTWNVLMFVQIPLTSPIRNVWKTIRRICLLILGLKRIIIVCCSFWMLSEFTTSQLIFRLVNFS